MRRPYALTTVGSWSLVFLAAFESLAVTTIMPIVTEDLDGRALYSLAFAATIAAGVVGMVVAGGWADSRGPAMPLLTAIGLFAAGLIIAGTAGSMGVFVAGRFLQGLGAGGQTVALYVLIAKVYPPVTHIRIFGAFASAWVLPSMVGPVRGGRRGRRTELALGLSRRGGPGRRGDRDDRAGAARPPPGRAERPGLRRSPRHGRRGASRSRRWC